jgi:hypothetical protein
MAQARQPQLQNLSVRMFSELEVKKQEEQAIDID